MLISGFAAISVWKTTKNKDVDLKMNGRSELSSGQKVDIIRFWDIYRKASDLRRKGEREEAVAVYRETLALNPENEDAHYYC